MTIFKIQLSNLNIFLLLSTFENYFMSYKLSKFVDKTTKFGIGII